MSLSPPVLVVLCQPRVILKQGSSFEKMLSPDWPVGKFVVPNWWLMWVSPALWESSPSWILNSVKKNRISSDDKQVSKQCSLWLLLQFLSLGSCLWLPSMHCDIDYVNQTNPFLSNLFWTLFYRNLIKLPTSRKWLPFNSEEITTR